MTFVVLILGLIGFGVYTGNPWFYLAAGIAGGVWAIFLLAMAAVAGSAKKAFKDMDFSQFDETGFNNPKRIRYRRPR